VKRLALAVVVITTAGTAGTGCDRVFGPASDPRDGPGGGEHDGPSVDGTSDCPIGTSAVLATSAPNADAHMTMDNPTQPFGLTHVANIGADIPSRGLFRFPIRTDLGPPIKLHVTVRFAGSQDDCGTSCGSCLGLERSGQVRAYAATSNWGHTEVSWNLRRSGQAWGDPGAEQAGTDRSARPVAALHVAGTDTVFDWKGADLVEAWSWVDNGDFTVLVVAEGVAGTGSVIISSTIEGVLTACSLDDKAAELLAVFCM
jgi:hypothetical protein